MSYDDDGTVWPGPSNGPSIYLSNVLLDNNVGTNWKRSVVGTDGAVNPTGSLYNVGDIGSPGFVPIVVAAPKIGTTVFGDGTAQRSMINRIVVDFDSIVTIADGAFILQRRNAGAWEDIPAAQLAIGVTSSTINGGLQTRATLAFSGTEVLGGSLADGYYRLTAQASLITSSGQQLDGDGNGTGGDNAVLGSNAADNFFRFFGDSDGNGIVTASDFNSFRSSFGKSTGQVGFDANFDFDGSGGVATNDFNQFRNRFGRRVNF